MPHYHRLGHIPPKRHITFRRPDGGLYAEQLVSTEGFSDLYSLVYHCHPPTQVLKIDPAYSVAPKIADPDNMQHRLFKGFDVAPDDDYLDGSAPAINERLFLQKFRGRRDDIYSQGERHPENHVREYSLYTRRPPCHSAGSSLSVQVLIHRQ